MQDFTFCPAEEKRVEADNAEWLVSWKLNFFKWERNDDKSKTKQKYLAWKEYCYLVTAVNASSIKAIWNEEEAMY